MMADGEVASTPVTRALDSLGIPYTLYRHPGAVETLEQAAQERGQAPEQVIRSLVFRLAQGEYVMVLIAGPKQVSWPSLRRYLSQSRLTTATQEEVFEVTGFRVGAVSPLGLPIAMRILADKGVFQPEEVSIGSGERGLAVVMKSEDLRRALGNVEVESFTN